MTTIPTLKRFIKFTIFSMLIILSHEAKCQEEEVYTNLNILSMIKEGLSESIIKNRIQQKKCNFNLTIDSLVYLKRNSVRDIIIIFMIDKMKSQIVIKEDSLKIHENNKVRTRVYTTQFVIRKYIE